MANLHISAGQLAAAGAILVTLIGAGITFGVLQATVADQTQEITFLRTDVAATRIDIQSLELYVRELHMNLGPMPRLDQPLPTR